MDIVLTDSVDAIICTFFLTSLSHISVLLTTFLAGRVPKFLGSQMLNNHISTKKKSKAHFSIPWPIYRLGYHHVCHAANNNNKHILADKDTPLL